MKRTMFPPMILLALLALVLMEVLSMRGAAVPGPLPAPRPAPLPTLTPTPTPIPGWWDGVDFATPTLPALPSLPQSEAAGGNEAGLRVPFTLLSCPTAGVKISDIRTAPGPWWHIYGMASIPNLWYWKAEVSADGQHWALLYRSQQAVASGLLVRLNLTTVPAGPLQMRLMAVDRTGNYPEPCVVQVM